MTSHIEAAVKGWFSMAILARRTMSRSEYAEALSVLRHLLVAEGRKLSEAIARGDEPRGRLEEVELLEGARHLLSSMVMLLKDKP